VHAARSAFFFDILETAIDDRIEGIELALDRSRTAIAIALTAPFASVAAIPIAIPATGRPVAAAVGLARAAASRRTALAVGARLALSTATAGLGGQPVTRPLASGPAMTLPWRATARITAGSWGRCRFTARFAAGSVCGAAILRRPTTSPAPA
jgi:hypothetical protein